MWKREREEEAVSHGSVRLISGFLLNPQWSGLRGSISLEIKMEEVRSPH